MRIHQWTSTDFNENNAVLLSSVKMKKVPKCILQGYSSNNTVYYDVVDSFAVWREGPNIEDLEPRMELPTISNSPETFLKSDNHKFSFDTESPARKLP